jgi:iron-sulfur cluster assembly protein
MITLTTSALNHLKNILNSRDRSSKGIRIGVETKGCSGMTYTMEYVDDEVKGDEVVLIEDVKIFIDPKASFFLIGTEMDYEENELESGFKFKNPNEKGRCGCGESFHI